MLKVSFQIAHKALRFKISELCCNRNFEFLDLKKVTRYIKDIKFHFLSTYVKSFYLKIHKRASYCR